MTAPAHRFAIADDEEISAIYATVHEVFSCFEAGDFGRALTLFTDDLALQFAPDPGQSREDVTALHEEGGGESQIIAITDVMVLEDGRIGAFVVDRGPQGDATAYAIFEQAQDGERWLVDSDTINSVVSRHDNGPRRHQEPRRELSVVSVSVSLLECTHWDHVRTADTQAHGGSAMSVIDTGADRRIFYDDLGDGPPLLLIPGAMIGRRSRLSPLIRSLGTHFRVIAMDLRDAGENDPERDYYTMSDLAGDALALLDALGLESVHVVGYSLGGVVAQQLTLDHPSRVKRLIVMSSFSFSTRGHHREAPMPPPEDWWSDDPVERTRRNLPYLVGPAHQEQIGEDVLTALGEADRYNRVTWEGVMRQQAAQAGVDLRPRLSEVRVPTLVLHGDADPIISLDRGEVVAASIPGARLCVLAGVGHVPWIDQPDLVTRTVVDFLQEV